MAGTAAGGRLAAEKNKKRDPDFYKRIGAKGGRAGHSGGFAAGKEGRERASKYGAIGGSRSRRSA
jgi:general stress protein YciG